MRIKHFFDNSASDYVYIIAEVAQNHDGSLGQAHAFIDACAETGVDAIKFQTHIAEAESSIDEPFRVKFSYEDATRFDYWKRMEFSKEQWIELKKHAEEKGLEFLSSAFSFEAFRLLDDMGMAAWKLGSGEVFNYTLLDKMAETNKPILLSSGMSTYVDLDNQIKRVKDKAPYAVFQCTTAYPNSFENVGLNVIDEMLNRYECPIGLSDHSGTIYPALAAVSRGAKMVEVHVTMSEYMFGPDVSSSLTIEQLKQLVEGVRAISTMNNNPINKNTLKKEYADLKQIFAKGIYVKQRIEKGEVISFEKISIRKPLAGISAESYETVLGKIAGRDLEIGKAVQVEDLI